MDVALRKLDFLKWSAFLTERETAGIPLPETLSVSHNTPQLPLEGDTFFLDVTQVKSTVGSIQFAAPTSGSL